MCSPKPTNKIKKRKGYNIKYGIFKRSADLKNKVTKRYRELIYGRNI